MNVNVNTTDVRCIFFATQRQAASLSPPAAQQAANPTAQIIHPRVAILRVGERQQKYSGPKRVFTAAEERARCRELLRQRNIIIGHHQRQANVSAQLLAEAQDQARVQANTQAQTLLVLRAQVQAQRNSASQAQAIN